MEKNMKKELMNADPDTLPPPDPQYADKSTSVRFFHALRQNFQDELKSELSKKIPSMPDSNAIKRVPALPAKIFKAFKNNMKEELSQKMGKGFPGGGPFNPGFGPGPDGGNFNNMFQAMLENCHKTT
eukprot:UN12158